MRCPKGHFLAAHGFCLVCDPPTEVSPDEVMFAAYQILLEEGEEEITEPQAAALSVKLFFDYLRPGKTYLMPYEGKLLEVPAQEVLRCVWDNGYIKVSPSEAEQIIASEDEKDSNVNAWRRLKVTSPPKNLFYFADSGLKYIVDGDEYVSWRKKVGN